MEDVFHVGIKAVIRNGDGKILLIQNDQDLTFDLPGGRMHQGESFIETLQRELREEIGVAALETPTQATAVLAQTRILTKTTDVGLVLIVYTANILSKSTPRAVEPNTSLVWDSPKGAGTKLAQKYPDDFCKQIGAL